MTVLAKVAAMPVAMLALALSSVAAYAVPAADSQPPAESRQQADAVSSDLKPKAAVSPGSGKIVGVDELRFNALQGRFTVRVEGVELASEREAIEVVINETALPPDAIALSRHALSVDYQFIDGINEVRITVPDADGNLVHTDGLYWSGSRTVVVDVVDATQAPVAGAIVTARLGDAHAIRVRVAAPDGTARFEHVPTIGIVVEAGMPDGRQATVAVPPGDGAALISLPATH